MFREKTIIKCRKDEANGKWSAKRGKVIWIAHVNISRLFRGLLRLIDDRDKVYSIDIIVNRRR